MEPIDADETPSTIDILRRKETKFPSYNPSAAFVKYRRIVVDWISGVGEQFQLQSLTVHMAIKHYDRYLSHQDVPKDKLQLIGMCCLLLSCKYDELCDRVPSLEDLNQCSDNAFTTQQIRECELLVLSKLEWELGVAVPLHFLENIWNTGAVFPHDMVAGKPVSKRHVKHLRHYIDFFAEMAVHEYGFQQFQPSAIAAAIVATARMALQFVPIWGDPLVAVTGYSQAEISVPQQLLWSAFEKLSKPEQKSLHPHPISPISPISPVSPAVSPISPASISSVDSVASVSPFSPHSPRHSQPPPKRSPVLFPTLAHAAFAPPLPPPLPPPTLPPLSSAPLPTLVPTLILSDSHSSALSQFQTLQSKEISVPVPYQSIASKTHRYHPYHHFKLPCLAK